MTLPSKKYFQKITLIYVNLLCIKYYSLKEGSEYTFKQTYGHGFCWILGMDLGLDNEFNSIHFGI